MLERSKVFGRGPSTHPHPLPQKYQWISATRASLCFNQYSYDSVAGVACHIPRLHQYARHDQKKSQGSPPSRLYGALPPSAGCSGRRRSWSIARASPVLSAAKRYTSPLHQPSTPPSRGLTEESILPFSRGGEGACAGGAARRRGGGGGGRRGAQLLHAFFIRSATTYPNRDRVPFLPLRDVCTTYRTAVSAHFFGLVQICTRWGGRRWVHRAQWKKRSREYKQERAGVKTAVRHPS